MPVLSFNVYKVGILLIGSLVKSIINELNFLNQNWVLYAFQMAFEDDEILYSMYQKGRPVTLGLRVVVLSLTSFPL